MRAVGDVTTKLLGTTAVHEEVKRRATAERKLVMTLFTRAGHSFEEALKLVDAAADGTHPDHESSERRCKEVTEQFNLHGSDGDSISSDS